MKGIKMNIEQVKNSIGDFGKDIKINLGNILSEDGAPGLKLNQIMGIALAVLMQLKMII